MSFAIGGVTPNAPLMMDIEEIHLRDDDAIAYYVYINGTRIFPRTYAPNSDVSSHCYFDVPADVVRMFDDVPKNLNYNYLKKLVESYRCDYMFNVGL